MLLKNTILTLIACGTMGATLITPLESQAISVSSYQGHIGGSDTWMDNYQKKFPTYKAPIASVYNGEASWYGPGFYGNRTASGSVYRPGTMTAAHRYLPFGTRVLVTNKNNGRSAVVTINDRGPYVGGRIIDLGEGAASALGVTSTGVAPVRLEVLN
jgi:rare lipoprotein A (peptidoglycan hydrolase)